MSLQTEQQSADAARQCYNVLNCFFYAPRIVEVFQIKLHEDNNITGLHETSVLLSKDPVRHNEVERSVTLVAVVVGEKKKNQKTPQTIKLSYEGAEAIFNLQ